MAIGSFTGRTRIGTAAVRTKKVGGVVGSGITVQGVPQAIRKMQLVGTVANRGVGAITRETAKIVWQRARARVPVESGNLKSGIIVTKTGLNTWAVLASSRLGNKPAKNSREYAQFVEYGSSGRPTQPFMRPAATEGGRYITPQLRALAATLERL
jgi:HK97 gp10 family phage protein